MLDKITPPMNALTSFVTFRLSRTQNKLNAQAAHFLKTKSDLSLVEWRIIQLLRLYKGATMSKLATEVQIDKGQLSRKITAMIGKGLVTSEQDTEDHRKHRIHLTPKAHELSAQLMPIMQKRQELLVAGVTPDELETFFKVLAVIDTRAEQRELP